LKNCINIQYLPQSQITEALSASERLPLLLLDHSLQSTTLPMAQAPLIHLRTGLNGIEENYCG